MLGRDLPISAGTPPPPPHPQASVSPPPLVPNRGGDRGNTLACERRGGRVPIRTRGQTLWYSRYVCTLWPWSWARRRTSCTEGPTPWRRPCWVWAGEPAAHAPAFLRLPGHLTTYFLEPTSFHRNFSVGNMFQDDIKRGKFNRHYFSHLHKHRRLNGSSAQATHCKKRLTIFPSPARMSLTKHSLAGNN